MERKHTPGPWQASFVNFNNISLCVGIETVLTKCGDNTCAMKLFDTVLPDSNAGYLLEKEEIEANVHLAAAAPELLDVAITLRDMLQGLYHGIAWFTQEEEQKIHSAISKALNQKEVSDGKN